MSDKMIELSLFLLIYALATIILLSVIVSASYGILLFFSYISNTFPEIAGSLNASEFNINIYSIILVALLISLCVYIVIKIFESPIDTISHYGDKLSTYAQDSFLQLEDITKSIDENNRILEKIESHEDHAKYTMEEISKELEMINKNTDKIDSLNEYLSSIESDISEIKEK